MALIRQVRIEGLNGNKIVEIPINNKHCILVGPNGSGKSTALQIIAYALGRQWKQLSTLRFSKVSFSFDDGNQASISKDTCAAFLGAPNSARLGSLQRRLLASNTFGEFLAADLSQSTVARYFAETLGSSPIDVQLLQRSLRGSSRDRAKQKEIAEFQAALSASGIPAVLYLPTYRRIELELNKAFEQIPEPYRRNVNQEIEGRPNSDFILELVRFGMEDVSTSIQSFERQTRDYARNRFNRMMTSYLKEMANSKSLSVRDLRALQIDEKTINIVLSRIEEGLLSSGEKEQISNIILELSGKQAVGNPPFNKKWLAQFFVRLLEVNRDIEDREGPIRSLVNSLNRYLHPKSVSYDIENYHFSISGDDGKELSLADLSSGEKQLVSILSQLYFSRHSEINVLIDEPELSLSVPWQGDFLVDLSRASACKQIFAVTHSPFIYDNSLSNAVVDFVEAAQ